MQDTTEVLNLNRFRSERLIEDGKHHVSQGDLDLAIEHFQKSIELIPTAEAYTFLAWVLSLKGELDIAIELCEKAAKINPEYGNCFNDIGHYLIQKGKMDEAIPWLEKAKNTTQYDTPHFPFINLGRVYSALGHFEEALREFRKALELCPGHKEVQKVISELEEIQNNA